MNHKNGSKNGVSKEAKKDLTFLKDKVVLVTGGTGSFGKKFVATVLSRSEVKKLVIFSRDELKQYEMGLAIKDSRVRFFLGDIRSRDRLIRAFAGVDYVVHAAALKQVPLLEYNPFEAVQTNILGTQNIVEAAIDAGVKKALAISTDKAVNPINLYGATKLCAEKLFVSGNVYSGGASTRFSVVRYGNVVGSRGSVIPLFLKQKETGKLTITDERMTRFWITLDQGVEFVLNSLNRTEGGEIFIPKIPSMKVTDLAKTLAPECKWEFTGMRPGEKVHEVLMSDDERARGWDLGDCIVVPPQGAPLENYQWRKKAKTLSLSYVYSSDSQEQRMTLKEMKEMIEALV